MGKINLLPEELINKIAAGEVVERPASVIKELLENAIDAKATSIKITIKNTGKDLIAITDNGCGMDRDDARTSIIRHATSKISAYTDLFNLHTLGFRGEALASIAAVSELTITTKTKNNEKATKITCTAGTITSETTSPHNNGTTIEVKNIFYNTPARKKFLKTGSVEMSHIIDTITNYALLYPQISFSVTHDQHELISAPIVEDVRSRISSIYGHHIAEELIEIEHEQAPEYNITTPQEPTGHKTSNNTKKPFTISGFISTPYNCRNDKTMQTIFCNGRFIKNNDIVKAIYQGYHARLFVGKHPIFVLHIHTDPLTIDVNTHPQKTEIKIEQIEKLVNEITTITSHTLERNDVIPSVNIEATNPTQNKPSKYTFDKTTQKQLETEESPALHITPRRIAEREAIYYSTSTASSQIPTPLIPPQAPSQNNASISSVNISTEIIPTEDQQITTKNTTSRTQNKETIPAFKLLGQFHKTFWAAETQGGIFFLDQHAVHERVMYDKFIEELQHKNIKTQTLLQPQSINIAPTQNITLQEHKKTLEQLGFDVTQIGPNTYSLHTIPIIFERAQPKELLFEVLESLKDHTYNNNNPLEKKEEEIITRMACRAAFKAGDDVTTTEFERIVGELRSCLFPFTCPHGRPSIIKITADELEKKFKRKG